MTESCKRSCWRSELGGPDPLQDAHAEIARLTRELADATEAKRRALKVADERSTENVALRAVLRPLAEAADIEAKLARHRARDMTSGAARVQIEYAMAWEVKRDAARAALGAAEQRAPCATCKDELPSMNWKDGKPYSYCPECGRDDRAHSSARG